MLQAHLQYSSVCKSSSQLWNCKLSVTKIQHLVFFITYPNYIPLSYRTEECTQNVYISTGSKDSMLYMYNDSKNQDLTPFLVLYLLICLGQCVGLITNTIIVNMHWYCNVQVTFYGQRPLQQYDNSSCWLSNCYCTSKEDALYSSMIIVHACSLTVTVQVRRMPSTAVW